MHNVKGRVHALKRVEAHNLKVAVPPAACQQLLQFAGAAYVHERLCRGVARAVWPKAELDRQGGLRRGLKVGKQAPHAEEVLLHQRIL